ncbi:MAG: endonuclease/exonuclease/phosphatase family protein [Phycisphaeraceae bacterium JB051]
MSDAISESQVGDISVHKHAKPEKATGLRRQFSDVSLLGLLQVIGVLPFIATFLGFFGGLHWTLDLLAHFRFQYLIVLTVVCLLLVYLKHRRLAALYLIGVVVNLLTVLPMYWPTLDAMDATKPQLTIMHFNVHVGNKDYDGMAQYISESKRDIVFIQELHHRMDERLRQMPDYTMICSTPRYDSFGIGMLIRNDAGLTVDQTQCEDITQGRAQVPAITAHLTWEDQPLAIMSLHTLPPYKSSYAIVRDTQLMEAAHWINAQTMPTVLIGDLNATPWSNGFRQMIYKTGLHNSAQGYGVGASWPADGGPIGKIPIDHCLTTDTLIVTDRSLGQSHGSDHLPLMVSLQMR